MNTFRESILNDIRNQNNDVLEMTRQYFSQLQKKGPKCERWRVGIFNASLTSSYRKI